MFDCLKMLLSAIIKDKYESKVLSQLDLFMLFLSCFLLYFRARLFIDALWSPAGKRLTSWLSFVMYNCEVVTFPLVSWVSCDTLLYRFLIFALFLTLSFLYHNNMKTDTISSFILEIQLYICTLGTNFVLPCTLYHMLYGIGIFSDYSFFLVCHCSFILKSKTSLSNAVKLIIKISQ